MILHDPKTEDAILRIATKVSGKNGFQKRDTRWWTGLHRRLFVFTMSLLMVLFFLGGLENKPMPMATRQMLCSVLMMLLVRAGMVFLGATSQKCGFFTTLANLPVHGHTAIAFIRSRFIRKFWWVAVSFSCVAAWGVCGFARDSSFLLIAALFTVISFATIILCDVRWLARLRPVKIWYGAGSIVIAYLVFLQFTDSLYVDSQSVGGNLIDRLLWIFPPTWILPGKAESGGLILASIWILWGLWSWIKWPQTACPNYDKPIEFFGAPVSSSAMIEGAVTAPLSPEKIDFEPPMSPSAEAWVNKLILRCIGKDDRAAAGAILDSGKNWTNRTNSVLVLAPVWLCVLWLGQDQIPDSKTGDFIRIAQWVIPIGYAILTIFPYSNSTARATNPYPLGAGHVPFFCLLPISIRSLLRISQRVTSVRCVIFGLIAMPFFWAPAIITHQEEIAKGLLGAIPAFLVVWNFSRPVFIFQRLQAAMKRKKGIFFLHLATSTVTVTLFFLWLSSGFVAVGAAYGAMLEPNIILIIMAIIGMILNAFFAMISLELLINEVRHRRYDWVSRMTP